MRRDVYDMRYGKDCGTCDMCKAVNILELNPRNENIRTGDFEYIEGGINYVCSDCAEQICDDWNNELEESRKKELGL